MHLLDIHTHNIASDGHIRIVNSIEPIPHAQLRSVGLHPWHILPCWQQQIQHIAEAAKSPEAVAIGECGIDTIKSPATLETQIEILLAHIEISERERKPLILHIVKAWHLLLKIAKETRHTQPWVIHGFRGNPTQAMQLIKNGMYISFGTHLNEESAKAITTEKLFIESDESPEPLENIYRRIAAVKGISIEELATQISKNAKAIGLQM